MSKTILVLGAGTGGIIRQKQLLIVLLIKLLVKHPTKHLTVTDIAF